MPKSRHPKPARSGREPRKPGNPGRRAAQARLEGLTDPAERAAARLTQLLAFGEAADPLHVISVLPLFMNAILAGYADQLPAERCVDDCTILACGYAYLGITAQVRAAELAITDTRDRTSTTHGTLTPWWEDDMIHGHTTVWLPRQHCLIDPTAGQYLPPDTRDLGPVIAAQPEGGSPDTVSTAHGRFRLTYTLASPEASAALFGHPRMRDFQAGLRRRGMNVASAAITLIAEHLTPGRVQQIPHPRAAALVTAIRDLPADQNPDGDWRFVIPGRHGNPTRITLEELPLPIEIPPAAPMP